MKKIIPILLLLLLTASNIYCQEVSPYIFPGFMAGKVLLKTGKTEDLRLNYNMITEEMVFENNGQYLAIANIRYIDTVYINERKFIPAGKVFYEMAVNAKIPLFIQHTCTLIPPGKPAGYGATTETSSVDVLSSLAGSGKVYELTLPDYRIISSHVFFIKTEGKYVRISNARHVTSVFAEKEAIIKDFVRKNKIDFQDIKDMSDLITFCNK